VAQRSPGLEEKAALVSLGLCFFCSPERSNNGVPRFRGFRAPSIATRSSCRPLRTVPPHFPAAYPLSPLGKVHRLAFAPKNPAACARPGQHAGAREVSTVVCTSLWKGRTCLLGRRSSRWKILPPRCLEAGSFPALSSAATRVEATGMELDGPCLGPFRLQGSFPLVGRRDVAPIASATSRTLSQSESVRAAILRRTSSYAAPRFAFRVNIARESSPSNLVNRGNAGRPRFQLKPLRCASWRRWRARSWARVTREPEGGIRCRASNGGNHNGCHWRYR